MRVSSRDKIVDVCIIGAGPCGISCAITAREQGLSVALVEVGNIYDNRVCYADKNDLCHRCRNCNVISGFGGCVHCGDSAKLSYYPSGKELYKRITDDYDRLLEKACSLWNVNKSEFEENKIIFYSNEYYIKTYPIRVMNSLEIAKALEKFWNGIKELGVNYYNSEMVDFVEKDSMIEVHLKSREAIKCSNIVLAMGRRGISWLQDNISRKNIPYKLPMSSIGFRFEMPREILIPLGKIHPDFKFRMEYNGYKYKTFCFCGGLHGGRLKFANHGKYSLLDGHVLTEIDSDSSFANFALMRQMIKNGRESSEVISVKDITIKKYISLSNGRPIYQNYKSFKEQTLPESRCKVSAEWICQGKTYELLNTNIEDYCYVAEKVFGVLAEYASCSTDYIINNTTVIGLELEGLWNRIQTDKYFKVNGRNIYVGGDCGGEVQGILQATIEGIRIAEGLAHNS